MLGTLKLAYVVFHPPPELIAVVEPVAMRAGLPTSNIIATASTTLIAVIFAAAAMMTILEAHYTDEMKKKFELFLAKSFFKFNDPRHPDSKGRIEPSKLTELIKLTNHAINALSLSIILAATWVLLFVMNPSIAIAMMLCASLMFALVLYIGSRTRKKSDRFAKARKELNLALSSEASQLQETDAERVQRISAANETLMLTRMVAAHDARSRVSKFTARLNAITLLSMGALIGLAILLMTDTDIVGVILILLLVRFFLSYAQNFANQLQNLSNGLDVLNWARATFSEPGLGK